MFSSNRPTFLLTLKITNMSYRNNNRPDQVIESKPPESEYTQERGFNFYQFGTMEGVIAGAIMVALLFLVESTGVQGGMHIFMQFAANIVLAGVIAYSLNKYKQYLPVGSVFRSGMLMGAYISIVTGAIIVLANLILTLLVPVAGISLFGMSALGLGDALLISFGMFIVTFVNGMIITFICLQFMKEKSSS